MLGGVLIRSRRLGVVAAVPLLVVLGLTLVATVAPAANCGDQVNGARVACSCGDRVVSDTVLQPTDPVVSRRCSLDGLVVRAPASSESITLDLNGLSLVGQGVGHGVRVESGGSDGARILGARDGPRGEIVSFGIGVLVTSPRALARIDGIIAKGNSKDGLRLRSFGAIVTDVSSIDNGADGFRLTGSGGRLSGVEASGNRRHGVTLSSIGTVVEGSASGNGLDGIVTSGARNDLSGARAESNGRNGVVLRGGAHQTVGLVSRGNAAHDLRRAGIGARTEP